MSTKKKVLAVDPTDLAGILNAIEGKYKGVTKRQMQKVLQVFITLETAIYVEGKTRSPALMMRALSRKKGKAFIANRIKK